MGDSMTSLSSRDNPLVKDFVRLCSDRGYREQSGRIAIEGSRLCRDALSSGLAPESIFITRDALEKYKEADIILGSGAPVYEITGPVAAKMADTKNPQGIFLTAFVLDKKLRFTKIDIGGAYIALENLQDPGNMGTILRTAEALGLDGVIMSADCADIYSPKVLRGTMGAAFRLPSYETENIADTLTELSQKGMKTVASVADRSASSVLKADLHGGVVAVIGNEGNGLTDSCIAACNIRVTIPMGGRAESLNASAAASILMWEISKSR